MTLILRMASMINGIYLVPALLYPLSFSFNAFMKVNSPSLYFMVYPRITFQKASSAVPNADCILNAVYHCDHYIRNYRNTV